MLPPLAASVSQAFHWQLHMQLPLHSCCPHHSLILGRCPSDSGPFISSAPAAEMPAAGRHYCAAAYTATMASSSAACGLWASFLGRRPLRFCCPYCCRNGLEVSHLLACRPHGYPCWLVCHLPDQAHCCCAAAASAAEPNCLSECVAYLSARSLIQP